MDQHDLATKLVAAAASETGRRALRRIPIAISFRPLKAAAERMAAAKLAAAAAGENGVIAAAAAAVELSSAGDALNHALWDIAHQAGYCPAGRYQAGLFLEELLHE